MPEPTDQRAKLLLLTDVAGPTFGTEDLCLFLYSLVRMQRPKIIVELGTGLGVSAFWMALAARQNGWGHVWTIDSLKSFRENETLLNDTISKLQETSFGSLNPSTPQEYYHSIATILGVDGYLTFIDTAIDLDEPHHFDRYPFADEPVDLLFSDFLHGPRAILSILGHFLPLMSSASSIFIDSASTLWPSYLLLEQLVAQINQGKIPDVLQEHSPIDLSPVLKDRRIILVHLTEGKARSQNSTSWLKLESVDLLPQPRTRMRGFRPDRPPQALR